VEDLAEPALAEPDRRRQPSLARAGLRLDALQQRAEYFSR